MLPVNSQIIVASQMCQLFKDSETPEILTRIDSYNYVNGSYSSNRHLECIALLLAQSLLTYEYRPITLALCNKSILQNTLRYFTIATKTARCAYFGPF